MNLQALGAVKGQVVERDVVRDRYVATGDLILRSVT
jgi:hypothetical protein